MTDEKTAQANELRAMIDAREIIRTLEEHILGTKKMTSTQVSAALALLKKILPDPPVRAAEEPAGHEDALGDLE